MIEFITQTFYRLIDELDIEYKRYLYPQFNINNRLTGLIGPRGVGKTTLLLQYIKNKLFDEGKTLYFSADLIYFNKTTLLEFIGELYQSEGYRIFFIDEIHKYQNWNQELKNLYDAFPNMKIVFSGSSMMDLVGGSHDLSRRAVLYHLRGMSFREYLNFVTQKNIDPIPFDDLLKNYKGYGKQLGLIEKAKSHFRDYLRKGYYPFVFEEPQSYYEKISRIIDKTIHEDIANYYSLKTHNLHYFKKILNYLASIPPGEVNTNNLAQQMGIDNKTAFHYLSILDQVGLARFIYPFEGGSQRLRKPQKIFLSNPTLLHALQQYIGRDISKGTLRELFFVQSLMDAGINTFYSKKGDFRAMEAVFEVGGRSKSKNQLKGITLPSYVVKDEIVVPSEGEIPLFYFGFLY